MSEQKFTLDSNTGKLSATLNDVPTATHVLLLAHGAGADHKHAHMASLAHAFATQKIAPLRFNFPFKQKGHNRVDSKEVSIDCICNASTWLLRNRPLPLLLGGHSFGGRMTTHAVIERNISCEALLLCSFPLHTAGKPAVDRAAHLAKISQPMIFLSGTRDTLADRDLLDAEVRKLDAPSCIHWLETGDHSFKILKRTRKNSLDIYTEASQAARQFIDGLA